MRFSVWPGQTDLAEVATLVAVLHEKDTKPLPKKNDSRQMWDGAADLFLEDTRVFTTCDKCGLVYPDNLGGCPRKGDKDHNG